MSVPVPPSATPPPAAPEPGRDAMRMRSTELTADRRRLLEEMRRRAEELREALWECALRLEEVSERSWSGLAKPARLEDVGEG